jgi:DNA mismatch repair ATPase MutS
VQEGTRPKKRDKEEPGTKEGSGRRVEGRLTLFKNFNEARYMTLDSSTLVNLEIFQNQATKFGKGKNRNR